MTTVETVEISLVCIMHNRKLNFYPHDAMLARVFATATCLSVCLSHAGIVPSKAKAGS